MASAEQIERYEQPQPRVALGLALREIAHAAIDISDGLLSEAMHLARASRVAIEIDFERIPTGLQRELADPNMHEAARHCLLATGDAYELLFTAPPGAHQVVARLLAEQGLSGACIGRVLPLTEERKPTVYLLEADGTRHEAEAIGWDHFAERD
jgi:Thiamine monophosphate kinase